MKGIALLRLKSPSSIFLVIIIGFLFSYRASNIVEHEISWDVLGYYMPLPATFIYNDAPLDDPEWLREINEEQKLSSTLYQISSTPEGKPMYFFLFGMSIFYSIFFFIGHFFAGAFGFPQDGFSEPYQICLVLGCMVYVAIGLVYLRKISRYFFDEKITVFILLVVVFGTNYIHHLTIKNLETVTVLFMLATLVIWNTIQFYDSNKFKNLLAIGIFITLMTLVKPSEALFILVPLLWKVYDKKSAWNRLKFFYEIKFHLLIVAFVCIIIVLPQCLYWYTKTGNLIYDSYKNPGVGLDLFSPHIVEALFSYRKGWLLYTPVMVLALFGFYSVIKRNKDIFPVILVSFLCSFYIVASWSEWWYGAGFSLRPMITYYPLLIIPLGYFLQSIFDQNNYLAKGSLYSFLGFCLFLNQFQWWQLKNGILDPYRTTKEYYWATFLKTSVSIEDQKLLLVNRDFWGVPVFTNKDEYHSRIFRYSSFDGEDGNIFYSPSIDEFALTNRTPYEELTKKDHIWVAFQFKYRATKQSKINLAVMIDRIEGPYGYMAFPLDSCDGNWHSATIEYLTPEIRNRKDEFKFDFWKQTPADLWVDDFKITLYEK
jgi:hypothetical protein